MSIKTKRHICAAVSLLAFILMLGIAGGVECGTMPLKKGAIMMFSSLAVWIAAAYKGGYLK